MSQTTDYRYFIYSQEHVNEKNNVLKSMGKEFVCGTVSNGSTNVKYSCMSMKPTLGSRYPDAKIVAQGDITTMRFKEPYTKAKRGV